MRVAVPTVWPLIFVGPGQKGKLDWLGDEIGFAHPTLPDILERAVVEEGPVPLTEHVTIVRKDKSSIFLGPSLTMPSRIFKKIEVKKTALRCFLDVRRGGEEEKEDKETEVEEEEFNSMLEKRREDLDEEERQEEDGLEEEEKIEEKKAEDVAFKKIKKSETDAEERRRLVRQGRRGGE